ncbi:hypothetical protein [Glycomyces buryatensis]|uniref:J domain-containing protein n=1 Tax=Glycomyces buryatensis TaxID=2570927 RepID=A0A4S8QD32_9ACTN|nr:hypothetical protein [Glycomyces buryatensis]THV42457.1 hypothetical protein FAB82_06170 [Glycomyces buryatensis]
MDDLYAVIGIAPSSTAEAIETKIKEQARLWNKRVNSPDINKRHEAENMIRLLDQARATLLDEAKRAEYDRELAADQSRRLPEQAAPTAGINWLDRAETALARNDYSSAAYAARQARELQGESAPVWAALYRSNLGLGNFQDALYEARQTLQYDPDDPDVHLDLGFINENLGDQPAALAAYQDAARHPDRSAQGQIGSAVVLAQMTRHDEALPILENLYSTAPPELDRNVTGDYLAEVLILSAEAVPANRDGDEYYITSSMEVAAMAPRSTRALEVAHDPEVRERARYLDNYVRSVQQKRFWPGFPVKNTVLAVIVFFLASSCSSLSESAGLITFFALVGCGLYIWYQVSSRYKYQWEINAITLRMNQNGY